MKKSFELKFHHVQERRPRKGERILYHCPVLGSAKIEVVAKVVVCKDGMYIDTAGRDKVPRMMLADYYAVISKSVYDLIISSIAAFPSKK